MNFFCTDSTSSLINIWVGFQVRHPNSSIGRTKALKSINSVLTFLKCNVYLFIKPSCLRAFLTEFLTWIVNLKFSWIIIPKSFTSFLNSKLLLLILYWNDNLVLFLVTFRQKHLLMLSFNFHVKHHWKRAFISFWRVKQSFRESIFFKKLQVISKKKWKTFKDVR